VPARPLDPAMAAVLAHARSSWPGCSVDERAFADHVARQAARRALDELNIGDLYLAFACTSGDAAALDAFERTILGQLPGWLARYRLSPAELDDVRQELRHRLFVATSGDAPKIASYGGAGPLGAWVRVVAMRLVLDRKRRREDDRALDDADAAIAGPAADPELAMLKERYRDDVTAAFRATLADLGPKERTILRMYFLDNLTTAQIGRVHGVTASTVSRWVGDARRAILEETQRRLAERARLDPEDLQSVLRLVQSQLDLSIARYLGAKKRTR
jgi:RNA polymerase sigma-70 factor, ECF subfamily